MLFLILRLNIKNVRLDKIKKQLCKIFRTLRRALYGQLRDVMSEIKKSKRAVYGPHECARTPPKISVLLRAQAELNHPSHHIFGPTFLDHSCDKGVMPFFHFFRRFPSEGNDGEHFFDVLKHFFL